MSISHRKSHSNESHTNKRQRGERRQRGKGQKLRRLEERLSRIAREEQVTRASGHNVHDPTWHSFALEVEMF